MTGIRKRVTIGFLSIVVLLFFSGLVSLFELNHMSADIESILDGNRRSLELSENMLDAISAHDRAVVNYAVFRDTLYSDSCKMRFAEFSAHIEQARSEASKSTIMMFDSLKMSAEQLQSTTMDPSRRLLRQITIENAAEAERTFSMLMGDDVPPRREFIEQNAHYANIDA